MTDLPQMPDPDAARAAARELLEGEPRLYLVEDSLVPNPMQGLWILSYESRDAPRLDGGGIYVDADGAHWLSSDPGAEQYVGALWPEETDDDGEGDPEVVAALAAFGVGEFGPPDKDFDRTVCVMAIPAPGDPVHGIGPEEKHATVLYFGDRGEHFPGGGVAKALLLEAVAGVAAATPPFQAAVTGVEPLGDSDPPAQVWLLDSPELHRVFEAVLDARPEVRDMYDIATENGVTRYPEYKPHVTIGYGPSEAGEADQVQRITFDRLSLWWGDDRHDMPLGADEFESILASFGE